MIQVATGWSLGGLKVLEDLREGIQTTESQRRAWCGLTLAVHSDRDFIWETFHINDNFTPEYDIGSDCINNNFIPLLYTQQPFLNDIPYCSTPFLQIFMVTGRQDGYYQGHGSQRDEPEVTQCVERQNPSYLNGQEALWFNTSHFAY